MDQTSAESISGSIAVTKAILGFLSSSADDEYLQSAVQRKLYIVYATIPVSNNPKIDWISIRYGEPKTTSAGVRASQMK